MNSVLLGDTAGQGKTSSKEIATEWQCVWGNKENNSCLVQERQWPSGTDFSVNDQYVQSLLTHWTWTFQLWTWPGRWREEQESRAGQKGWESSVQKVFGARVGEGTTGNRTPALRGRCPGQGLWSRKGRRLQKKTWSINLTRVLGLRTWLEPHQMGSRDEPQRTTDLLSCLTQVWIVPGDCLPIEGVGLGHGGMEGSGLESLGRNNSVTPRSSSLRSHLALWILPQGTTVVQLS